MENLNYNLKLKEHILQVSKTYCLVYEKDGKQFINIKAKGVSVVKEKYVIAL